MLVMRPSTPELVLIWFTIPRVECIGHGKPKRWGSSQVQESQILNIHQDLRGEELMNQLHLRIMCQVTSLVP